MELNIPTDPLEKRIWWADKIARILIMASVIFIGYGAVVGLMVNKAMGNQIMIIGLIFVALFGVAVYTKRNLQLRIDSGKTFHQGR